MYCGTAIAVPYIGTPGDADGMKKPPRCGGWDVEDAVPYVLESFVGN